MMNRKMTTSFLVLIFIFSLGTHTQGQQAATAGEAQILKLRKNIQMMLENAPPPDAPDAGHRSTLLSLRGQLRDLLLKKSGALESRIQNLQTPDALPEVLTHVEKLKKDLQGINDEIAGLKLTPEQALTVPSGGGTPPAVETGLAEEAAVLESPDDKARKESFAATVNNISDSDLKEAAAPTAITESKLPQPGCDADGNVVGTSSSKFDQAICGLAGEVSERRNRRILLSGDKGTLLPILIAKLLKTSGSESFVSFISEAQEARTDQQIGAGPSSSGTTSLVTKGGVPYALGFAVENGAAVQSQSGTTITFRLNPAGTLKLFTNQGFITGFRQTEDDAVMKFLRKSSIGLTFDTSRGSEPGIFTGNRQQLSEFSYRVEFFNDRDPRLKKYERDWEQFVASEGIRLAEQIWATTIALNDFGTSTTEESFKDPALQAWLEQTNKLITAAGSDINDIARVIKSQTDLLPVDLVTNETVEAVTNFARQFKAYTDKKNELLDRIARGKVFTLEYTNKREVNAPDTSNFRFISATGTGRRIDLTANGSITWFNKRPVQTDPASPRLGRIRDFQFAGQVDIPFGDVRSAGQFVFWFSGRYERLLEDASTQLGEIMPNTKGDIAVGQFGLKIPIKGLGMKFPVSVTFANRTELVKEKEVRGNFGFTFNLDTLLSRFNPF
jgi:hypothetical protein